jgi:hypothetical protein
LDKAVEEDVGKGAEGAVEDEDEGAAAVAEGAVAEGAVGEGAVEEEVVEGAVEGEGEGAVGGAVAAEGEGAGRAGGVVEGEGVETHPNPSFLAEADPRVAVLEVVL